MELLALLMGFTPHLSFHNYFNYRNLGCYKLKLNLSFQDNHAAKITVF
jgi:hypothetical protein